MKSEPASLGPLQATPADGLRSIMNPLVNPPPIVVEGLTYTTYWGIPGSMWWTKKVKRAPKAYAETLEERMDVLEAALRTLKAEWLDIYDKLYRLAGRMDAGRRWEAHKAQSPGNGSEEKAPENTSEGVVPAPAVQPAAPSPKLSRTELMRTMTG